MEPATTTSNPSLGRGRDIMPSPPPIFLLKTPSTPTDMYEQYFRSQAFPFRRSQVTESAIEKKHNNNNNNNGESNDYDYTTYDPIFVPVLSHRFHEQNLAIVKSYFSPSTTTTTETTSTSTTSDIRLQGGNNAFSGPGKKYGGIIFTSQRAVEAFGHMLDQGDIPIDISSATSKDLILYSVGPATTRTLTPIRDKHLPFASIHGDQTGNGETLARFILEHYNQIYTQQAPPAAPAATATTTTTTTTSKPGLLFLVGEQRRDIIPKTLMHLPINPAERIHVDELVVYETTEMPNFESQFRAAVAKQQQQQQQHDEMTYWTAIFSPAGCETVLRTLRIVPPLSSTDSSSNSSNDGSSGGGRKCRIVTIGRTTRDYLFHNYGYEPDVVAQKPSPEGIGEGIREYLLRQMELTERTDINTEK